MMEWFNHFLDTTPKPSLIHSGLVHTSLVHLGLANSQEIQESSLKSRKQNIQNHQEFQAGPSHTHQSNQEYPELILSARRIQENHQAKVINVQPIATDCQWLLLYSVLKIETWKCFPSQLV